MAYISKKNCVACQNKLFVGDVGEVLSHLCKKHKKEEILKRADEIREWLKMMEKNKL